MPATSPNFSQSPDDMREAIIPLIAETLTYLTDGCLLSLEETPVLIPRKIVDEILGGSLPIFLVAGDWGQGKSFTGKLLYRRSKQLLYSDSSYKYYVTYLPLSIVYSKVNQDYQNFIKKFYGDMTALSKEPLPMDARKFLSIILPIIFSPNIVRKNSEIDEILTTLPQTYDLDANDYTGSLLDVARAVLGKIDSKLIVILDELEDVEGIFSIDRLGKILYLFRVTYDQALSKGNTSYPTMVLLLQEYARAKFASLLEQLGTQPGISRTYGATPRIRTLDPITKDDMVKYINDLLNRMIGKQTEKIFTKKSIEDIVNEIERMNLNNTRLKIALIRQILSNIIAQYIAMYPNFVSELQRLKPPEIVKNRVLEDIFSKITITTPPSMLLSEIGLSKELNDILSEKFERISKYADMVSEITAKEIHRIYRNIYRGRVLQASPISRAKGYKAYEVFIKSERGGTALRLIVWARLTDINVEKLDRRKILSKFHLTEQDIRASPTRILLVYTSNVKWVSRLQAVLYDLIVPLPIEDGLTLAAILTSAPGTRGSELTRGLHQEFKEALRKIYEERYVSKIRETIEDILEHR